ncbi:signal peptide peptidase SppA [Pedomonas mirosovicensis]|uniref:signal peptide peptidase SppA n=1 Tax=Pedomonas mirosovicensis TaxID=2908641 RepID=UPI0021690793|nr:signal peptide peptidase SppA [Pedomonas mirosovicensis]MCH8684367.1 signal peptide peptidase SppA [Pedomonas mirosovicensis]
MLDFLKMLWRAFVALKDLVFGIIAIVILLGVIALLSPETETAVPDKAALLVRLDGYLVEQRSAADPLALLGGGEGLIPETLLRDVVKGIDRAAKDKRISALTLELDGFYGAGPGALEAVGDALERFKKSGKPIYAYGRYYTEPQYYLASLADEVWLHPMGGLLLRGYGQYNVYLKDALDRLKVTVNVFQAGKYKSFIEPYTRAGMSEPARVSLQSLYDNLWQTYVRDVEAARKQHGLNLTAAINGAADSIAANGGDLAEFAIRAKAVDKLGTYANFVEQVQGVAGSGEDMDGLPSYNQIDLPTYVAATAGEEKQTGDAVGVIYVSGEIVDGEAPPGMAGGDTIARLIRQAVNDDSIKALVVRIDSPGGSATAAEAIREQLMLARLKGLPVVTSMGSIAASGGYWVAAGTDEIWAEPSTITGSIGVFGILPTFERTLNAVGIQSDGIGTTPLSDIGDLTRPLSPDARRIVQSTVENTYRRFLGVVSQNRNISIDQADAVGQGRPWSGATAKELKLVDHLGGLDQAVAAAARRAKLEEYRVVHVDPIEPWAGFIMRKLVGAAQPGAHVKAPLPATGAGEKLRAAAVQLATARVAGLGAAQAVCLECLPMMPPRALTAAQGEQIAGLAGLVGLTGMADELGLISHH